MAATADFTPLLERIDFDALRHIKANNKKEAKDGFSRWWEKQVLILAENFMRTIPADAKRSFVRSQWKLVLAHFALEAKNKIQNIDSGLKYIKDSKIFVQLAQREGKKFADDFFWRINYKNELQQNILDYLNPTFHKFTAGSEKEDLSRIFNRLSHFSCGQELLMFPLSTWVQDSYIEMIRKWYSNPTNDENKFNTEFSQWWSSCLQKIDAFLFATLNGKTQIQRMLEQLFPDNMTAHFYAQQWPELRKAYCMAYLQIVNGNAVKNAVEKLAGRELSKDEHAEYANTEKDLFLLKKTQATLETLPKPTHNTAYYNHLDTLLTTLKTTGKDYKIFNDETQQADNLSRVFTERPQGKSSQTVLPLQDNDFKAILYIMANIPQDFIAIFEKSPEADQLIPDDEKLNRYIKNIFLMDPTRKASEWFGAYSARILEYLKKVDADSGKYFYELMLDALFPEKAGDVEMYAEYFGNIQESFFRTCNQALVEEILTPKPNAYATESYDNQIKNAYIHNLLKLLKENMPNIDLAELSPYSLEQLAIPQSIKAAFDALQAITVPEISLEGLKISTLDPAQTFTKWWHKQINILLEHFNHQHLNAPIARWHLYVNNFVQEAHNHFLQFVPETRKADYDIYFNQMVDFLINNAKNKLSKLRDNWLYQPEVSLEKNITQYLSQRSYIDSEKKLPEQIVNRAFENVHDFMGTESVQKFFPVPVAAYTRFFEVMQIWPQWYEEHKENPANLSIQEYIETASIDELDPNQDFWLWWAEYGAEIDHYLFAVDEKTDKYRIELFLEAFFAKPIEEIDTQQYIPALRNTYIATFMQEAKTVAIVEPNQHIEIMMQNLQDINENEQKQVDSFLFQQQYAVRLASLVTGFPQEYIDKPSPYMQKVNANKKTHEKVNVETLSAVGITPNPISSSVDYVNANLNLPNSPEIAPESLIEDIISKWFKGKEVPNKDKMQWAEFQIVNFDRYLHTIQDDGKFVIQQELDKLYKKNDKTPDYEHYVKYEKDFHLKLISSFIKKLADSTKNNQDDLVSYHHNYIGAIKVEEILNREHLLADLKELFFEEKRDKTIERVNYRHHILDQIFTRVTAELIEFFHNKGKGERHSPAEYNSLKDKILATIQVEAEEVLETKPKPSVTQKIVQEFKKSNANILHMIAKAIEREQHITEPKKNSEAPKNLESIKEKLEAVMEKHTPTMSF